MFGVGKYAFGNNQDIEKTDLAEEPPREQESDIDELARLRAENTEKRFQLLQKKKRTGRDMALIETVAKMKAEHAMSRYQADIEREIQMEEEYKKKKLLWNNIRDNSRNDFIEFIENEIISAKERNEHLLSIGRETKEWQNQHQTIGYDYVQIPRFVSVVRKGYDEVVSQPELLHSIGIKYDVFIEIHKDKLVVQFPDSRVTYV